MPDSATIASQLSAYNANPVTSTSALNDALGQFGVPEIRNTVSGLRTTVANTTNALNNVDPSVTGRTSGSLVTEAQREKQVNNERAPIAQELSGENSSLSQNQQALNDALGQATSQANAKVADYNSGRTALEGEYSDAYQKEQDDANRAASIATANIKAGSGGSGGSSSSVNPSQEFLNYISGQFKSAGKDPSRQSQDAWANAWFAANKVPVSARNAYWNLFNSTYKRSADPTKDRLYAK